MRACLLLLLIVTPLSLVAQTQPPPYGENAAVPFILDSVEVVRARAFDTTGLVDILNTFHALTREEVVLNEVFVDIGDTVTQYDLDELDRNLRRLDIFSRISFEIVPFEGEEKEKYPLAILRIVTKDAFSLRANGSLQKAGSELSISGSLWEVNLLGMAQQLGVSADHTTINDRGWRLSGSFYETNISDTHIGVALRASWSKLETAFSLTTERPFYSDRVPSAFRIDLSNSHGDQYFYSRAIPGNRYSTFTKATDASGWYAWMRGRPGNRFMTAASMFYDRTIHDSLLLAPRAFENSVGVFGGIGSLRRQYVYIPNADLGGDRQVGLGGMGSVSIGKIIPHHGGLDNVVYVGAEARQASMFGPLYLFGHIAGGTGLAGKQARFTVQKAAGTGWLRLTPTATLAARVEQATVWNWPRYLYLPLDNSGNLRGYEYFTLFGDNRLTTNLEFRQLAIFDVWLFEIGAAAFYDLGAVWNQGEQFSRTRFHSSAGLGLRIGSVGGTFNRGLLRVDLAYNFDDRRIARIVISSNEAFDAFGTLEHRPPGPYGP